VKWCLDKSISSQVTTPVTAQDLSAALISALESNTVSPVSAPNDVTFDILLAEDNLVNQKLAVKILEKYGHTVEIAENGSLAVDAFKARVSQGKPFDIILVSYLSPILLMMSPFLMKFLFARWMCLCRLWVAWRPQS
jgi:osomolarity two-component system sensor histidine kinase NIK1